MINNHPSLKIHNDITEREAIEKYLKKKGPVNPADYEFKSIQQTPVSLLEYCLGKSSK